MNAAILHKKIAGVPVPIIGVGLAGVVILYRHFTGASVASQSATTTPADTTTDTGDPTAVDAGVPTQYGYNTPSADGTATGGAASTDTSYSDALSSLADSIAGLAPVDNSQDFSQIESLLGTISDQTLPDHSPDPTTTTHTNAVHKTTAAKAQKAHAVAKSQGGRVQPKTAKKVTAAPAKKAPVVTHPKAVAVAHHAPAPAKKKTPAKKKK